MYKVWSFDFFSLDRDGQMKMDVVSDNFLHVLQKIFLVGINEWIKKSKRIKDLWNRVVKGWFLQFWVLNIKKKSLYMKFGFGVLQNMQKIVRH